MSGPAIAGNERLALRSATNRALSVMGIGLALVCAGPLPGECAQAGGKAITLCMPDDRSIVSAGMAARVVRAVFERAGVEVDIRPLLWIRCVDEVRRGDFDGLFPAEQTAERELFLRYSQTPLLSDTIALFVTRQSAVEFGGDLTRMLPLRVGIMTGLPVEPLDRFFESNRPRALDRIPTSDQAVKMLLAGRIDVLASSAQPIWKSARDLLRDSEIRQLSPPLEQKGLFLAFTRAHDVGDVVQRFDEALGTIMKDGSLNAVLSTDKPRTSH